MSNFMKVAEAVAASGLSRAHIYRLIDQGKVPSQSEGRLRKVDVDALKRFVSEAATKPRRGRRPGSGKAAQLAKAAQAQSAGKSAKKTAAKKSVKTTGKTTRKAAPATVKAAPKAAPKAATKSAASTRSTTARKPAATRKPATTRKSTVTRKTAATKRPAVSKATGGNGDAAFLRGEVKRLRGENDRLLKIIESLTRRA